MTKINNNPMVSVIIPTHNNATTIENTLNSVANQHYKPIEIIVVDDHSTDNTNELVSSYKRLLPIKHIKKNENTGTADTRNEGIINCSGEWIQFLDSDDIIKEDKIRLQSKYFQAYDIIYSDCNDILDGTVIDDTIRKRFYNEDITIERLLTRNILPIHAPIIRKTLIDSVGFFSKKVSHEDWDFWLRVFLKKPKAKYTPGVMCSYIRRRDSRSYHRINNLKNQIRFLEYAIETCIRNESRYIDLAYETIDNLNLLTAKKYFQIGDEGNAEYHLKCISRNISIQERIDVFIWRSRLLSYINNKLTGPRRIIRHIKKT